MKAISAEIVSFFQNQGFTVVSTVDGRGRPHSSCKGIVKISPKGEVFLLDVYRARTLANLKKNPNINITAVDEHKFRGYCLKGKAKIIESTALKQNTLKAWEDKITSRVTQRVLKNVRGEKGHLHHPEIQLPRPEYMIYMKVEEIVDLTPRKIK
ncbi:MAG: pyridoxamine 5'-phosphate oxidase family protein [Candidatus Omnitrophica bacterium]|nr:pyridoxamine 5'-phosphate oxidase family protein [Candidatus Omnitrophota bacterium]